MIKRNKKIISSIFTAGLMLVSLSFTTLASADGSLSLHTGTVQPNFKSNSFPYYRDSNIGVRKGYLGAKFRFGKRTQRGTPLRSGARNFSSGSHYFSLQNNRHYFDGDRRSNHDQYFFDNKRKNRSRLRGLRSKSTRR